MYKNTLSLIAAVSLLTHSASARAEASSEMQLLLNICQSSGAAAITDQRPYVQIADARPLAHREGEQAVELGEAATHPGSRVRLPSCDLVLAGWNDQGFDTFGDTLQMLENTYSHPEGQSAQAFERGDPDHTTTRVDFSQWTACALYATPPPVCHLDATSGW